MGFQIGKVLKAVYALLGADTTLMNLIDNIYVSEVTKNKAYPYIVLGNNAMLETPFNVFGKKGKETLIPILIYDVSRTPLEIIAIAERIDTLLDWKDDLSIDGNDHIVTAIQNSDLGYDINTAEGSPLRYILLNYKITSDES